MADPVPASKPEEDHQRIIERPDGYYWLDESSDKEYGPFPTRLAATQDMQGAAESEFEEGVPLAEAESEIGITDWIDRETGEPAEEKTPRLPEQ